MKVDCFLSAMAPYVYSRDAGGAYPYMDLNAKYEKRYYDVLLRLIQIDIKKITCIQIFRWIQVYYGLMQRLLNTSRFT
jgi:hypothetical protein